jgi:hypothetical protein
VPAIESGHRSFPKLAPNELAFDPVIWKGEQVVAG